MTYLDANVFVHAALNTGEKAFSCKNILLKVAEGRLAAATSALTWGELVWAVKRQSSHDFAKAAGAELLKIPNLKFLAVDSAVISEAQRLISEHNLDPRDAIHAASAIKHGIKEFVSDDTDFDAVAGIKRIRL